MWLIFCKERTFNKMCWADLLIEFEIRCFSRRTLYGDINKAAKPTTICGGGTNHWQQRATRSLFFSKMIALLERAPKTHHKHGSNTNSHIHNESYNKQWTLNRTFALERTVALPYVDTIKLKSVQPPLKLRSSKWCSFSSFIFIEYSRD